MVLLASDSVPVCAPEAVGAKVMLRVHCAPAASMPPDAGQAPLLAVNAPVDVNAPKVMGEVLVLVAVTDSWPLCPRFTEPKSSEVGASRSGDGVVLPRSVTYSRASEASEEISSAPVRSCCVERSPGVNCTRMVQAAAGSNVEQTEFAVKSAGARMEPMCSVVVPLFVSVMD